MKKNYIVLVGLLPKQGAQGGAALGFESLINGCRENQFPVEVIDMMMAGTPYKISRFSLKRLSQLIHPIILSLAKIPKANGLYMTIGCSFPGFLRDAVLIWFAWIFRVPIILHLKSGGYYEFYGKLNQFTKFLVKLTLNRSNKIIALGHSIRSQFAFVSNYETRVAVVYNGPPEELHASENIGERDFNKRAFRVLYLSNLIPSKGYGTVLQTAKILNQSHTGLFEFHICGAFNVVCEKIPDGVPGSEVELDHFLKLSGLEKCVTYHGTVSGENKYRVLEICDALVLPTQYPTEGQPICVVEAMAFGLPCLVTPWKGLVEQVIDGETGYFIRFNDPENLLDKLLLLKDNPEKYRAMCEAAKALYEERFSRKQHIRRMLSVMEKHFNLSPIHTMHR